MLYVPTLWRARGGQTLDHPPPPLAHHPDLFHRHTTERNLIRTAVFWHHKAQFDRWYQHIIQTSWLFRIEDKEVVPPKASYLTTTLYGIPSDKMKMVRVSIVAVSKSYSNTRCYHHYTLPRTLQCRSQINLTSVHIIVPSESMAMQHAYEVLI